MKFRDALKDRSVQDVLNAFQQLRGKEFFGPTSYRIARNIANVEPALTQFETTRIALIKKYGRAIGKTDNMIVDGECTPENMSAFKVEYNALLDEDLGVTVKAVDLASIPPDRFPNLTPDVILLLDGWFLIME